MTIDRDLNLIGAGQEESTLEVDWDGSVLTITVDASVSNLGASVTGGSGTLNDDQREGSGVFNNLGEVSSTRTAVGVNQATVRGGGIFSSGELQSTARQVNGNDAHDDDGGIFNLTPGEVALAGGTTVTQNDPNNCVGTIACGA